MAWDIRTALGAEKTDPLMFSTIVAIDMTASLADSAEALLATADVMLSDGVIDSSDRDQIQAIVEARGMLGCQRIAPLDEGVTRLAYSGTGMVTSGAGGGIAPVHYRLDIPADAERLNINLGDITAARGDYTIHWRVGGPVRFVPTRNPPVIAQGSLRPGEVMTRDSDPPLPRCQTLYFAVRTENLSSVQATLFEVTANLRRSGLDESCEEPDAGPGAEPDASMTPGDAGVGGDAGMGGDDGGCGCRVQPSKTRLPFVLAALALSLGLIRRRRLRA